MRSMVILSLAAETFVAAGAQWLHVVDMDLAFDGVVANAGSVASTPRDLSRRVDPGERRYPDP